MGWVMGFEPTNTGTTIRGLRPLGDTHHVFIESAGLPEGTRLINVRLRRAVGGNARPRCISLFESAHIVPICKC